MYSLDHISYLAHDDVHFGNYGSIKSKGDNKAGHNLGCWSVLWCLSHIYLLLITRIDDIKVATSISTV